MQRGQQGFEASEEASWAEHSATIWQHCLAAYPLLESQPSAHIAFLWVVLGCSLTIRCCVLRPLRKLVNEKSDLS